MRPSLLTHAVRLASLVAIAAPASVFAGGFSLNEQSASAMGVANAGAAANPENATTVFFNPAGMSQLKGTNISFGAAVLDIDAEAKSASAVDQTGQPVSGGRGGDIADPAVLPNFYLTHEINESIDVGFGIHAPYGLSADYNDDFAGRYFADKTELTVISFSPGISVNNGQGLSMGIGINVMYAEGKLTKFQDYSGTYAKWQEGYDELETAFGGTVPPSLGIPDPSSVSGFEQGYADIEGDDIAVNFQVGFLYELSSRTQFGLTAQTGTEFDLKGDADISGIPQTTDVDLSAYGQGVKTFPTGAQDSASEAVGVPLAIPESITVGARHQLTDAVTLLAGATYSKWSRFEELDIVSREGGTGEVSSKVGDPITHITEKWKNTWQFNLGSIWQVTPEWALKAGYAWDESPVDNYLTARIPSSDRHWLTLGGQWKSANNGWTVDAAVGTLLFADDPKVNEFSYQHDAPTQQDPSAGASNYQGEYDLSAWSASLQVSKAF